MTIQLRLLKYHKIYQSSAKNVGEIVDIDVTSQASQDSSESSDKNFEMDDLKVTFLMTEKLFNLMLDHSHEVNAYLIQIKNL